MPGFVINPGWLADVYALTDMLLEGHVGPEITEDAKAQCPVFGGQNSTAKPESLAANPDAVPGALRDSIRDQMEGHTLIVSASGSATRSYALFVELGHEVVAWGKPMGYSKPPQPFLLPALLSARLP